MAWAVKERNGPVAHGSAEHTWAEGRSGESDTFPFSFAATPYSKAATKECPCFGHWQSPNRCSTLHCYLLITRVNYRNGRHFRSSVGIVQLFRMGVPGGCPN